MEGSARGHQRGENGVLLTEVPLGHLAQILRGHPTDSLEVAGFVLYSSRGRFVVTQFSRHALHRFTLINCVRLDRRLGGGELLRADERGAKLQHQLRGCLQRVIDLLRRQGHRRGDQAWIPGRIGEDADVIHQRSLALHLQNQASRVALTQDQREQIERRDVLVLDRGNGESQVQVDLFDVIFPDFDRPSRPRRFRRPRREWAGAASPIASVNLIGPAAQILFGEVTGSGEHHVPGRIISAIELEHAVASEAPDRLFGADHRTMVGMGPVGGGEEVARRPPGWQVVGSADLLANHLDFFRQLRRIEGGVAEGVAKNVQAHLSELARHHHVVHGLVKRGPGVDLPAALLDLPRNFSRSSPSSSLEQHVLVQVRQTGLVRPLIRASCIHPDLESSDLRRMLLLKDHPETVLELKALSHCLGQTDTARTGPQEMAARL